MGSMVGTRWYQRSPKHLQMTSNEKDVEISGKMQVRPDKGAGRKCYLKKTGAQIKIICRTNINMTRGGRQLKIRGLVPARGTIRLMTWQMRRDLKPRFAGDKRHSTINRLLLSCYTEHILFRPVLISRRPSSLHYSTPGRRSLLCRCIRYLNPAIVRIAGR